ncbi:MAG: MFS transporter [Thermodesulfobacteriota bacterium]
MAGSAAGRGQPAAGRPAGTPARPFLRLPGGQGQPAGRRHRPFPSSGERRGEGGQLEANGGGGAGGGGRGVRGARRRRRRRGGGGGGRRVARPQPAHRHPRGRRRPDALFRGESGMKNPLAVFRATPGLFGWVMYDFANSAFTTLVVTFIYATYFTKAIAADEISGTVLWSRGVTASCLAVAFLSPVFGFLADRGGNRKSWLLATTWVCIGACVMLATALPGETTKALLWFVIANIAFELGNVFYNAFLPDIATGDSVGRVSGWGWGVGYLGGLLALILALVGFVNPETPWFGLTKESGQHIRATNLLVAAWFALFSLPTFIGLRDRRHAAGKPSTGPLLPTLGGELAAAAAAVRHHRQALLFLAARLLYNDGLITVFAFGGIYAAGVFGFSFSEIILFGIVLNVAAGVGAFAMGRMDDRFGGRKTLLVSLVALSAAALVAVCTDSTRMFWLAGILVGVFAGPNQSASRSLMARFSPPGRESQFFGLFALSGKMTAFLGPLLLGVCTDLFHSQRAGMASVLLFFAAGFALLLAVDEEAGKREGQRPERLPEDGEAGRPLKGGLPAAGGRG